MSESVTKWHAVGLAGSVAIHLGALAALGATPVVERNGVGPTTVEFEVPPPPPPEPPKPVEEPQVEDEQSEPLVPTLPADLPPPEPIEPEPAEPEPEEPVELTGLTLTNDGAGDGWTSQVGNGQRMRGPIRRPSVKKIKAPKEQRRATKTANVSRAPKPKAPSVVPMGNLSKRPAPPPLNGKLASNYPPDARRRGEEGTAVVTALVDADGRVRVANVVTESGAGFGDACRRTVLGSVWSTPRDTDGRAVATQIRYTCQFRVDR